MEKIREKNTAWLETIRSFFVSEEDSEDEKNNGYEEWKRANADIIDQKAIANLEKMLEHQAKKSRKTQIQSNASSIRPIIVVHEQLLASK